MTERNDILIGAGRWKLTAENLHRTSDGRHWSGIAAEIRRHVPGEVPEMISDRTVVAYTLRGNPKAIIHRRGNGLRQAMPATTGTFWLCPEGVVEDEIHITGLVPEMLHIYLPRQPFRSLSGEDGYPDLDAATVAYRTGNDDPWISQVGRAIVAELAAESASGRVLIETAGLVLAAALAHGHATRSAPFPSPAPHGLEHRRLRRVIDYMDAHLDEDITVGDLAEVAHLSRFHFLRAFKAATGVTPNRYLSARRLVRAKEMLEQGDTSLSDLAQACRFSSQANFSRAFRRAVGMSPGAYRRSIR